MRAFFLLPSSLFCSFTLLALVAAPVPSAAGVLERAQAELFDEPPNNGSGSRTPYNVFVSREAAELAALRYTGHTLPADAVPRGILAAGVLAREEGYFFVVDGIGDNGREAVLDSITPKGEGYVLSGTLRDYFGDEGGGSKKTTFTLELAPGDAPGTWKRLSWTETDSK